MMAPYPFFGFPMARRPYPYYSAHNPAATSIKSNGNHYFPNGSAYHEKKSSHQSSVSSTTTASQKHASSNAKQDKETETEVGEECFEIFGIKLYFDDLLLIALLFFLYQEEVKDTYLYIALVLLLLS